MLIDLDIMCAFLNNNFEKADKLQLFVLTDTN